jgi:hypothetical protein
VVRIVKFAMRGSVGRALPICEGFTHRRLEGAPAPRILYAEGAMIGFKVLTKDGLKGPFQKSSVIKAITSAQIPLSARLLDLETGRYMYAAELVGEKMEARVAQPKKLEQYDPDVTMPMRDDKPRQKPEKPPEDSDELRLA